MSAQAGRHANGMRQQRRSRQWPRIAGRPIPPAAIWGHTDSTLCAAIPIKHPCRCLSMLPHGWALSSRACRRPLKRRLPALVGCPKSSRPPVAQSPSIVSPTEDTIRQAVALKSQQRGLAGDIVTLLSWGALMSDDEEIQTYRTNDIRHFDMDEAFCARMRRAIEAGRENAPIGVVKTPGTESPKCVPAGPRPPASPSGNTNF
jgi:hypothetical protein